MTEFENLVLSENIEDNKLALAIAWKEPDPANYMTTVLFDITNSIDDIDERHRVLFDLVHQYFEYRIIIRDDNSMVHDYNILKTVEEMDYGYTH